MNDSDSDLYEGVERWAGIMNERGHASAFARLNTEDKQIVERSTAQDWCDAVRHNYGLVVEKVRSNPDPNGVPDCFADCNGETISLELTELVDAELLDEISKARKRGVVLTSYSGEGFQKAQWDESRFTQMLSRRLDAKKTNYERNNAIVDVLIIHTDEPWLSPAQVQEWLPRCELEPNQYVRSAYLLMTYCPGDPESCPVFRIC